MSTQRKISCMFRTVVMAFALAPAMHLAMAAAAPDMLKEAPAKGVLRVGEVVYVDDGSCPPGEVKKITGGNQKTGVARQVHCVKRPEGR